MASSSPPLPLRRHIPRNRRKKTSRAITKGMERFRNQEREVSGTDTGSKKGQSGNCGGNWVSKRRDS